jgi:RNA polymerase sigma-70 factor, ECF subfamily
MTADQLTQEFESFQGELKSFLLRITTNVQDTEDLVQDAYLKAQAKIDTFRGELR